MKTGAIHTDGCVSGGQIQLSIIVISLLGHSVCGADNDGQVVIAHDAFPLGRPRQSAALGNGVTQGSLVQRVFVFVVNARDIATLLLFNAGVNLHCNK